MRIFPFFVAVVCMVGCDAALCGPEYSCEGSVIVRCDVVCTGGGKFDPPRECHRVVTRRDCRDEAAALGVDSSCKVIENVGVCLDAPLKTCQFADPQQCTSTGAYTACTEFLKPEYRYVSSQSCGAGRICSPAADQRIACIDNPKVSCDPDAGFPRCSAHERQQYCMGAPDTGYFQLTQISPTCRDGG